jgi:phospholipid/cholesterol/gamma-HCH transport system permease protein
MQRLDDGRARLRLAGRWTLHSRRPAPDAIVAGLRQDPPARSLEFDGAAVEAWDSSFLTYIRAVTTACGELGIAVKVEGLPEGPRALLELASTVAARGGPRPEDDDSLLHRLGVIAHRAAAGFNDTLAFVGELTISLARFVTGRARFRRADLWALLNDCGVQALPIVSLISVLVGLILAFVGAVQLQQFGAQIFVANLVGIAMAREMGAMMTAIVMAGRTGAAFAAQIGTMQVNEEVDALRTIGVSSMDFLVAPRTVALIIMMPLLCVYAIVLGIIGGMIVGVGMLGIEPMQYLVQTQSALGIADFAIGIFKSVVFGVIIAVAGCMYGIQCGRSASDVGSAATSAVVTAIVVIVVADGLFAVITNVLGI